MFLGGIVEHIFSFFFILWNVLWVLTCLPNLMSFGACSRGQNSGQRGIWRRRRPWGFPTEHSEVSDGRFAHLHLVGFALMSCYTFEIERNWWDSDEQLLVWWWCEPERKEHPVNFKFLYVQLPTWVFIKETVAFPVSFNWQARNLPLLLLSSKFSWHNIFCWFCWFSFLFTYLAQ